MSNGNHPINGLMDSSLQNLRSLVDADTVIGEAITTPDGITIIPVSKVTFGFAAGGSDLPTSKPGEPFGGGAGSGVTVQPVAFLVIRDGQVELLQINDNRNTADRMVGMVPELIDKLGLLFQKKKDEPKPEPKPESRAEFTPEPKAGHPPVSTTERPYTPIPNPNAKAPEPKTPYPFGDLGL